MLASAKLKSYDKEHSIVTIDLKWKKAWKNDKSFDGVYIFLKYKEEKKDGYKSMKLTSDSGTEFENKSVIPQGFSDGESNVKIGIYAPDTRIGFFVYTDEICKDENVEVNGLKIPVAASNAESIEVFAIEMVYIPEGKFTVGDPRGSKSMGGKCINGFYTYPDKPMYSISSEEKIIFGENEGNMFCDNDTPYGREETNFVIPAEYPKGYKAMWYMKHPLTMGQWVQYLNCLTRRQQQRQVWADISQDEVKNFFVMSDSDGPMDGNEIFCRAKGNGTQHPIVFFTNQPHRIANLLNWFSAASFACFAGLRPVTELEYVKACRGPEQPKPNEFAWGTSDIGRAWNYIKSEDGRVDIGLAEESGGLANCNYGSYTYMLNGVPQPYNGKVPQWGGCLSETVFESAVPVKGYSERVYKGAGYYGVMELCGTAWENVITVGNKEGRAFKGNKGSGELTPDGEYAVDSWPEAKTGKGFSQKGGNYMGNPNFFVDSRPFGTFRKTNGIVFHGGARLGF